MNYNVDVNRSTVTKSFFWKILERLSSQGINLIVQIVLARLIAPGYFGSLAIIVALTNYTGIFLQAGITTVIVQKQDLEEKDVSTLLTLCLGFAAFFYAIFYFIAPSIAFYYDSPILSPTLRVLSLILFLSAFNSVQTGLLQRKMQFKKLFWRSAIAVPVSGAIGIIMAVIGFGLWALVVQNLVSMLIIVVFMSIDKQLRVPLGFSFQRMKSMFGFSSKIILTGLISGSHDFIRTMLIGKRYSKDDLAYYDKGVSYSSYVTMIINQSMSSVLLPAFSRKQDDEAELKNMSRRSVRLTSFIMIPTLVAVAFMAKPLVVLLLSAVWLPCVPFLAIFCLLRIPGPIMIIDKQVYYALGKSEVNLYYEIGLFICNISVLLYTIRVSVLAIAIGAFIVELLGSLALCVISNYLYNYSLAERFKDTWRPILSSLIMAICLYWVSTLGISNILTIFLQLLIAVVVYMLLSRLNKDDNLKYCINTLKEVLQNNNIFLKF